MKPNKIASAIRIGNMIIVLSGSFKDWEIIETSIVQCGNRQQITTKIMRFNSRKLADKEFNRRKKLGYRP